MMKILISLLLLPLIGYTQTVEIEKNEEGNYAYQEIINVENTSKDDIYVAVERWAAVRKVNNSIFIAFADYEKGKFICNIETGLKYGSSKTLQTIEIDIKEEKYRITASNFVYLADQNDAGTSESDFESLVFFEKRILSRATKDLQKLMDDLHKQITAEKVNDDW